MSQSDYQPETTNSEHDEDSEDTLNVIVRIINSAFNAGWFARQELFKLRVLDNIEDVSVAEFYNSQLNFLTEGILRSLSDEAEETAKDDEGSPNREDSGSDAPSDLDG